MKRAHYLLMAFLFLVTSASAQRLVNQKFMHYEGTKGIKKKLSELKQITALLRPQQRAKMLEEVKAKEGKLHFRFDAFKKFKENLAAKKQRVNEANSEEKSEASKAQTDAVVPGNATEGIWSNFLASSFNETPFGWPPDPNGDAGESQVAVITNGSLKIFEKKAVTEPPVVTPKSTSDKLAKEQFSITLDNFFFPLFGEETISAGDPHIRYDRLTKKWFVIATEINFSFENNRIFLAVSDGDRISDETSFIYYSFPSVLFPVSPDIKYLPFLDFPTLGVDKSALLIGGSPLFFDEFFNIDSVYSIGYIVDKKALINGKLSGSVAFLGAADNHNGTAFGMAVPQGVQNSDAQAIRGFFAGISFYSNALYVDAIDYDKNNVPIAFIENSIRVPKWNFPRDITAPGSPMPIESSDTRLLAATITKNKYTGKSSLWTAHAVGVDEQGNYVSDRDFTEKARTASRWYEIDQLSSEPKLIRTGTLYDATPSGRRATMYFNPSIVASGQGHVVLGGTTAAYNKYLDVFVADRYYGEEPGLLHTPTKATETRAIYAPYDFFLGYVGRWGDFSQTVVDPMDDQTIWTFQEYANADDSYGTRAVQLKAPPPANPVPIRPIPNNGNWDIVITGDSENHSSFFDPGSDPGGPGFNRLTIKSTGGIIVGNIRVKSPTEIRCRIYAKGKAPGKYQLIITNPDGQFVTSDYEIMSPNPTIQTTAVSVNKQVASRYLASSGVYPNPTPNDFKLVVNASRDMRTKIVVTDISGKEILSKAQFIGKGSNTVLLSLASVTKGAYMVVVRNENNVVVAVHKVIKE